MIYALVDCNNFYVSCERLFNPRLENKPVVILSNNDGCVVSRSNEAKRLGITMGAPFFKWKSFCFQNNVTVLSSNYALYADISSRVMNILGTFSPEIEFYSIDEAFLLFRGIQPEEAFDYAQTIRSKILKWTGIPVSVGLAPTKTLSKVANYIAKKKTREGFFSLIDESKRESILKDFPVEEVWGIGKRLSKRLSSLNIYTAGDLKISDPKYMRKQFSVVMERLINELKGIPCLSLETVEPRKQIISSRSFGTPIDSLRVLEESVSHYTAQACIKLRKQDSLASGIYVFIQTDKFVEGAGREQRGSSFVFPAPTQDTRSISTMAKQCLGLLYRRGEKYKKSGIILFDLVSSKSRQQDLFVNNTDDHAEHLMRTVDRINERLGKNTLFYASEGIEKMWSMKSSHRSPSYTTSWSELAMAYA